MYSQKDSVMKKLELSMLTQVLWEGGAPEAFGTAIVACSVHKKDPKVDLFSEQPI